MAGARISIKADGGELVLDALRRLEAAAQNMEPVFSDIGEYLELSHEERWNKQESPEGIPWAPLSPVYAARKQKKGKPSKILVLDGYLKLLHYNASNEGLKFGTDRIYGATMHFGAEKGSFKSEADGGPIPWGDIPARPFLGISEDDREEILARVTEWLEEFTP